MVLASPSLSLVVRSTLEPASLASNAAEEPAPPPPITSTSTSKSTLEKLAVEPCDETIEELLLPWQRDLMFGEARER